MKVFVCFAAICFLALVMALEEDIDLSEVREARAESGKRAKGMCLLCISKVPY